MPDYVNGFDVATTLPLFSSITIVPLNAAALTLSQASVYIRSVFAGDVQITVPLDTSGFWAVGASIHGIQISAFTTTLVKANAGIIFNCYAANYRTRGQGSPWSIIKIGATEYDVQGDFQL